MPWEQGGPSNAGHSREEQQTARRGEKAVGGAPHTLNIQGALDAFEEAYTQAAPSAAVACIGGHSLDNRQDPGANRVSVHGVAPLGIRDTDCSARRRQSKGRPTRAERNALPSAAVHAAVTALTTHTEHWDGECLIHCSAALPCGETRHYLFSNKDPSGYYNMERDAGRVTRVDYCPDTFPFVRLCSFLDALRSTKGAGSRAQKAHLSTQVR